MVSSVAVPLSEQPTYIVMCLLLLCVLQGEGFPTPTNERHCVNSASIKFEASQ